MREVLVAHLMTTELVTLRKEQSLPGAAELMKQRNIRHLPVVDDDAHLVGLVTHRDILAAQPASSLPLSDDDRSEAQLSIPVERIMRRRVWTVRPGQRALDAARLLFDLRFGCAPVVDDDHCVIGIVTEADFLSFAIELLAREPAAPVAQLMTPEVVTLSASDAVPVADVLMELERVRHLPVVEEDGRLTGIVTHRDLLGARHSVLSNASRYPDGVTVRDIARADPLTASADTPLVDAARLLERSRIGCLPVIDQDLHLVGIVTEADFLRLLVDRLTRASFVPRRNVPVNYYMSAPAQVVTAEDTLDEVQERLARRHVSGLVIVDDRGHAAGVISRRDLLRVADPPRGGRRRGALLRLPRQTVGDTVTMGVFTTTADAQVTAAAATMLRRDVHRLVVVEDGRPVGVLSTSDLALAVRDLELDDPAERWANTPIFTVGVADPIGEAARLLDIAGLSGLVVEDRSWPVGMFTREQMLAAADADEATPLEHVMDEAVICVPSDMPLRRVAGRAAALGVDRAVVMKRGYPHGVLTGMDFARALVAASGG